MDTLLLSPADPSATAQAVDALSRGQLVALPTETVYGLGADATNGCAVAAVFAAKGRPRFNPLICHVGDLAMAERLARLGPLARRLAERFWPGPLTLVLPALAGSRVHPLATGSLATVALRSPVGIAGDIIRTLDRPVAAPSANPSGRVSPTTAAHVMRALNGRIALVLDGGPAAIGLESTIVKPLEDRLVLLRAGAVSRDELLNAAGLPVVDPDNGSGIEAPGRLRSHYAPHGSVRLNALSVAAGEHLITFAGRAVENQAMAEAVVDLSPSGDLREAAANLFATLAALDCPEVERIAVAPIPREGLGEAINDRLERAAAPR